MISVSSTINWLGQKVTDFVYGEIDQRMNRIGQAWLSQAQATVHVDTGEMRAGLFYRAENRTLVLGGTSPHTIFEEYGTRYRPPHPKLREALLKVGSTFGFNLELEFAAPSSGTWQGLYAHKNTYVMPSSLQPRPLTRAQHEHVKKHLIPVSQRLYKGNVKRAKMRVRKLG